MYFNDFVEKLFVVNVNIENSGRGNGKPLQVKKVEKIRTC